MIDAKAIEKLEKFIPKSYVQDLQNVIVYQNEDGSYELFNKYKIVKNKNNGYMVYIWDSNPILFYSLKNAVAWCTYDKRNRILDAERIYYLDSGLMRVDAMIEQHQRLAKKSSTSDTKLIYLAKLTEEKLRKKQMAAEMSRYVYQSMLWQTKQFARKP